jgi:hypothetical protein
MQLDQSDTKGKAFRWFYLCMANWQLGEKVQARKCYDNAVQWMEQHKNLEADISYLSRYRTEAQKVMNGEAAATQPAAAPNVED